MQYKDNNYYKHRLPVLGVTGNKPIYILKPKPQLGTIRHYYL